MAIFHHRDSEAFTKGLLGVVGVGLLVGAASCSEDVVNVVPVERVQLSPAGDTITQHEHIEFSVTVSDGEGRQLQDRQVQWAVEPASIGTINEGEFSSAEVGDGQIRATVEGVSGAADVAVLFQAEVQGSVTHAGSGDPVEGAVVTGAHPYQSGSLFEVESDEAGRYEADFLLEEQLDEIVIEVEAAGYQSVNDEASLEEIINLDVELDLREYELAVDVEPGEGGDVDPAAGTFEHGMEVEVEAKSEDGYAFSRWTGGLSGENNPLSFVMDSHVDATAVFEFVGFQATVVGALIEEGTGNPIVGGTVRGTDADSDEQFFQTETDEVGEYQANFTVQDRPQKVLVEGSAGGYEPTIEQLPFDEEVPVDIVLIPEELHLSPEEVPTGLSATLSVEPKEVEAGESLSVTLGVKNDSSEIVEVVTGTTCLAHPNVYHDGSEVYFEGTIGVCGMMETTHTFRPGEESTYNWGLTVPEGAESGTYLVRGEFDIAYDNGDLPPGAGTVLRVR